MSYPPSTTSAALARLKQITAANSNIPEGFRASAGSPIRHKCFVSYHSADAVEVLKFVEDFQDVFIPRAIGMEEDGSDIIDSTNVDHIRDTIRERYLWDSTVTIVAIGSCTWARKFVDWEIYSSLRNSPKNRRNGLVAVQMPSVDGTSPKLPDRLEANLAASGQVSYAKYWRYPNNSNTLRAHIQEAFDARDVRVDVLQLGGRLRERNSSC